MELDLSTSSDNALYLYQVLQKYLIGFQSNNLNSGVNVRVVANVDWTQGRTDERTENCKHISPHPRGKGDKRHTLHCIFLLFHCLIFIHNLLNHFNFKSNNEPFHGKIGLLTCYKEMTYLCIMIIFSLY